MATTAKAPNPREPDFVARSVTDHHAATQSLLSAVIEQIIASDPDALHIDDPELLGRVTAVSLRSKIPLPPFDNSQMDGYAVVASDLAAATERNPVDLRLGPVIAAGDSPRTHQPGTASPIMTGAAIPDSANAIVPVEATVPPYFMELTRDPGRSTTGTVSFTSPVPVSQFIRYKGSDVPQDSEICPSGTRLTPARIGALAAGGICEVPVRRRPRVVLCTTGDELFQTGPDALTPGQIYDSNTPMLCALLQLAGAQVHRIRCPDQPTALLEALAAKAPAADLVVTSGGISAGAFEVVREALGPSGVAFGSVAMQPGGPQGLGMIDLGDSANGGIPVLCFPGNPVSSLLSAELFLVPALRRLAGLAPLRIRTAMPLAHETHSPVDKLQLRRGRINADGTVTLTAAGSHLMGDLATADIIAELPVGMSSAAAGTLVQTWRIND